MTRLAMVLIICVLLAGTFAFADEYCDDMETGLWTFGHTSPVYDGSWGANYVSGVSHSGDRSIRMWLMGGGTVGLDSDCAYATRDFSTNGDRVVDGLSVWFASMDLTVGSPPLDAGCYVKVYALDIGDDVLDEQGYMVLAYDDNDIHQDWEHLPGWYYQECRPAVYEPGAPDYCRLPDHSIQPPVLWWYMLDVDPSSDLAVNWQHVYTLRVELCVFGCFLHGDHVGMMWDDFCYQWTTIVSPIEESSWGTIKALWR
jgi:hypothetical protein